jgi:predicted esterase
MSNALRLRGNRATVVVIAILTGPVAPLLMGAAAPLAVTAVDLPSGTVASAPPRSLHDCSGLMPPPATSGEVRVATVTLKGVPALLRRPARVTQPPVLLWHGFGPPESEEQLMRALPLDEVPAVKVYLGLPMFGSRAPAGGMQELVRRQQEDVALQVFEPIVMGAAKELPKVLEALAEGRCMLAGEPVAIIGFSAGGAAVLAALAERRVPIDAAVTLNASTGLSDSVSAYERATGRTYAWSTRSRDLASRSDAVKRAADIARNTPALLLIHGMEDPMLRPESAQKLYDLLLPLYAQAGAELRLRLSLVPGLQHTITPPATAQSLNEQIAQWLRDHRRKAPG